jgi:hypothetical protein
MRRGIVCTPYAARTRVALKEGHDLEMSFDPSMPFCRRRPGHGANPAGFFPRLLARLDQDPATQGLITWSQLRVCLSSPRNTAAP